MIITLDNMGERYGLLPSEVLARASTLDLYVMDAALSYRDHQQKKSNNEIPEYDPNDLMAAMEQTRRHQQALGNG
jgi:hypothetical protein